MPDTLSSVKKNAKICKNGGEKNLGNDLGGKNLASHRGVKISRRKNKVKKTKKSILIKTHTNTKKDKRTPKKHPKHLKTPQNTSTCEKYLKLSPIVL